jgi:hypothetical protein
LPYSLPQPIVAWILFGPLARTSHVAALEGEATNVEAALHAGVEGRAGETLHPVVTRAAPSSGRVDLHELLSQEGNVCGYAVARVDVLEACRVKLWIGSDDGASAWVNGKRVLESSAERSWTPDEDKLEVDFVPGPNFVVLRVEQAGGDWAFSAKASEPPVGPLFEGLAPAVPPVGFDAKKWRAGRWCTRASRRAGGALLRRARPGLLGRHAVGGVGPKIGPDLRDVGAKYPRAEPSPRCWTVEPHPGRLPGDEPLPVSGDVLSGSVTEKDGVDAHRPNAVQHEVHHGDPRAPAHLVDADRPVEALTCEQFTDLVGGSRVLK